MSLMHAQLEILRSNAIKVGPLIETSSPLLDDFNGFMAELEATFGQTDWRRMTLTKHYSIQQGSRAASIYALKFQQIACEGC